MTTMVLPVTAFTPVFPRPPEDDVPIGHVTNGVRMPTALQFRPGFQVDQGSISNLIDLSSTCRV